MLKKHPLLIVFFAGLILLLSGIGSSYYWLTRIYLPDQINSNIEAKKLQEWIKTDSFIPPVDKKISPTQLENFLLVNESLSFFLQQIKNEYNDSQWHVVFEMINRQPQWQAKKYLALKKFNLSPLEYEFITNEVSNYWMQRLKEKSAEQLTEMGWEVFQEQWTDTTHSENYKLFMTKEDQLNSMFSVFLTKDFKEMLMNFYSDSAAIDSLP